MRCLSFYWQVMGRYRQWITALADFFKFHKLSKSLLVKTNEYVDAMWHIHKGIDTDALLDQLPYHLREEIMMAAHKYVRCFS